MPSQCANENNQNWDNFHQNVLKSEAVINCFHQKFSENSIIHTSRKITISQGFSWNTSKAT